MISNAIIAVIFVWAFMASVYTGVIFIRQRQIIRKVEMIYNATVLKPKHDSDCVAISLHGIDDQEFVNFVNIRLQIGDDKVVRIIYDVTRNEARCYTESDCLKENQNAD